MPGESEFRKPPEAGLAIEEGETSVPKDNEEQEGHESNLEKGGFVIDTVESDSPIELDPEVEAKVVELKQIASERSRQILDKLSEIESSMAGWSDPTSSENMRKFVEKNGNFLARLKNLCKKKDGQITLSDMFVADVNGIFEEMQGEINRIVSFENDPVKKEDPVERARIASVVTKGFVKNMKAAHDIGGSMMEIGSTYLEFRDGFEELAKRGLKK